MHPPRAIERTDLRRLGTALVAILVGWWVLGARPGQLLGGNDLASMLWPYYDRLREAHGDWRRVLYDPAWIGGGLLEPQLGALPLLLALARIGVAPVHALNAVVVLVQGLFAYFGLRIVDDWAGLAGHDDGRKAAGASANAREIPLRGTLEGLAWATVFAFLPVLGWRLVYGHLLLAFGALLPTVLASVLLATRRRSDGAIFWLTVFVTWAHTLPHPGQQTTIYAFYFGLPLLVGLVYTRFSVDAVGLANAHAGPPWARSAAREWNWLRATVGIGLVGIAAALVAGPHLLDLAHHLRSTDPARTLAAREVVYSHTIARPSDLWTSLPWGFFLGAPGWPASYWHEVNYPVGPVALFALLLPWRRFRALHLGVLLSLALAVGFSMRLPGVSDAVLALPLMTAFRVPERALWPVLLLVSILWVAAFATERAGQDSPSGTAPPKGQRAAAIMTLLTGVGALLVEGILPSALREVLAVGLVAVVTWGLRTPRRTVWASNAMALVPWILAATALHATGERTPPRVGPREIAALATLSSTHAQPSGSSLVRSSVADRIPGFDRNTAWAAHLPALEGLGIPGRRFLELYAALRGEPYQAIRTVVELPDDAPDAAAWRQLFPRATPSAPNPGVTPARFVERVEALPDVAALARVLRPAADEGPPISLADRAHVIATDPLVARIDQAMLLGARCNARPVRVEKLELGPRLATIDVADGEDPRSARRGPCPLVLAINHVDGMYVDALDASGLRSRAASFPIEATLVGVMVPANARRLELFLAPGHPPWSEAAPGVGLLLGIFASVILGRPRKKPVEAQGGEGL